METKLAKYEGFNPGSIGQVAYVVDGNNVYFSGLTSPYKVTSTINAAEIIIDAICEAEGIDRKQFTFYDIQTHRGYNKQPGVFEVDRLVMKEESNHYYVDQWIPTEIPNPVQSAFKHYINESE